MKWNLLARFGKPRTSPEFERQAVGSARRRRLQMIPGNEPATAPGEDPVTHYLGKEEDVVLGPEPESIVEPSVLPKDR